MATFTGSTFGAVLYNPGNPLQGQIGAGTPTPSGILAGAITSTPGGHNSKNISPKVVGSAYFADVNQWFMNDIWAFTTPVAFGNIVSDKTVTLNLLNTFRYNSRTLTSVDTAALTTNGVTQTAGPTLPKTIRPIQQVLLDYTAAQDGTAAFDLNVNFTYDHAVLVVNFTGSRSTLFWFPPEMPMREQLSWATDIIVKRPGTEQRNSLSVNPRQTIGLNIFLDDATEGALMRNMVMAQQPFLFGVPLWWDMRTVTVAANQGSSTLVVDQTAYADFAVGRSVLIFTPDRTRIDLTIDSLTSNSITFTQPLPSTIPVNSYVMPLRFGYLTRAPQFEDPRVNASAAIFEFMIDDGTDVAFDTSGLANSTFTLHPNDSLPVLVDPNMTTGASFSGTNEYPVVTLDNGYGKRSQLPKADMGRPVRRKTALANTYQKVWEWRQLVGYLRGSWGSFYLPSFQTDLEFTLGSIDLSSALLNVKYTGARDLVGVIPPQRDLYIQLPDGRNYIRRVSTITDGGNDTDNVTLDTAPEGSSEVVSTEGIVLSWVRLVRIEGDQVNIVHGRPGLARFTFSTIGLLS